MTRTVFVLAVLSFAWSLAAEEDERLPYRSPLDLVYSPSGEFLAVSDRTAGEVVVFDGLEGCLLRRVPLHGEPAGVAFAGDRRLLVAEYGAGTVAEIALPSGAVERRLRVGLRPMGIAVSSPKRLLVAANTVTDDVSVVDLDTGSERAHIRVPREPFFVAVTPDGSTALAANLLPRGSADDPQLAAVVSMIDLAKLEHTRDIRLPPGSTSVRAIAVAAVGGRAVVAHTIGRFHVPATQLDRGWVNTNAFSILDLSQGACEATLLLDQPFRGAADPWGVALSANSSALWVSLRGTHELARVDLARILALLAAGPDAPPEGGHAAGAETIWDSVRRDPGRRHLLASDLSALHVAGAIERIPLPGRGPRGIALAPDGRTLAVALYHTGTVALVDAEGGTVRASLSLGPQPEPDSVRRGEMLFHDATLSFQHWLSCSTCHPDEARTDGLRWDLLNDGLGTPQRTRSLLWAHRVRPTTARGVRAGIEESVPKGLLFLLHVPEPEIVEPLLSYLRSLEPEPSPWRAGGALSAAAERGRALFEDKAGCARCHEGELGSDLKAHDVGTRGEFDRDGDRFITPRLVELYRTAPFLHDGRAATLEEVVTKYDALGRHGDASKLDRNELADLVEYLKSR